MDDAISLLNTHFPSVLSEERQPLLGNTKSPSSSDSLKYVPFTSVDPTHLALNLRVLAFIEAARTVPLPYHPPGTTRSSQSPSCSPSLPTSSCTRSKLRTGGSSELTAHQQELLHRAQSLYAEAQSLTKPEDRALYLGELGQVTGLLAYTDPENSAMAPYLTQGRREALAEQIESAILCEFIFLLIAVPIYHA